MEQSACCVLIERSVNHADTKESLLARVVERSLRQLIALLSLVHV